MKPSIYLPIIGMEIHVELRTKSKMFCGCPSDHFGKKPNTQTCPVCLGLPGALPVPNRLAVTWAQMIGLALNCRLCKVTKFDRKHYFYPDLPKGYQISQYDEPLCVEGLMETTSGKVRITRVHLEEDTGKLQHKVIDGKKVSLVDFNRSGVALVEIVSEPDIHSALEAKVYAQEIRKIVNFLGVSDADMETGSMRLEANISLYRLPGGDPERQRLDSPGVKNTGSPGVNNLPPYKVEVKNINSFRFLEKAINFEIDRQQALLDKGETPTQETRGFSEAQMATVSQRSKEEAKDYRYFPEPDIPPMEFSQKDLNLVKKSLPMLPHEYRQIFTKDFKLRPDYTESLVEHRKLAEKALACFKLAPDKATSLASFLINKKAQAESLAPEAIVAQFSQASPNNLSNEVLSKLVSQSIKVNPDLVAKYKAGKTSVLSAFIGEIMRQSQGRANPQLIKPLLEKALLSE